MSSENIKGVTGGDEHAILDCRKEMTANIRKHIASEGIRARVRAVPGSNVGIQVFPVAHDISFTETEQRFIRTLAVINNLTAVKGLEIDVERMTDPYGMNFYLSEAGISAWRELALKMPNVWLRQDAQPGSI